MAGADIVIAFKGQDLKRFDNAIKALGSKKARDVYRLAINRTIDGAFTKVKPALAKQVGLSQAKTIAKGGVRKIRANYSALEGKIVSRGRHISLKEFKPRQFKAGTKASPWGKRQLFESAFMGPRPGAVAVKLAGHVFVRSSSDRHPIEKLWGPAVPVEMVKEESAAAFESASRTIFPRRVEHEIKRLSKGVFT